ncbi:hypothetical protein JWG42_06170 [Desulfoprunum benzoelyticum]|uniref:Uncharacterized protein n=1 Tax=Desulfoprunum benzoelyticum TaxID=1506996 RepID=A0A840UZQ9_9BACT|nr:hypothetical protein [Desulfoprunum benzoelyticum]MBB5347040.1 hypothetical protein [Desulfoprunum benzoelyticum]MBM9529734.1 hypothetical protein [Desulfoprunum benzoelyticum]
MNFVFICPETNAIFATEDFSLAENHGVQTDHNGGKVLHATVVLNSPCPYCRKIHRYRAKDLACPFHANSGASIQLADHD